jgi:hypothetical protein
MQASKHHWVCLLCGQAPETMQHFILACPFSRQVCHEVLSWLRFTCTPPDQEGSLMEWWSKAYQDTPKPLCKGMASKTLLTPWMVWKQRSECVFKSAQPSIDGLVSPIKDEAKLGAVGVCRLVFGDPRRRVCVRPVRLLLFCAGYVVGSWTPGTFFIFLSCVVCSA